MFRNDSKFRPCLVNGQKALFHRFTEVNNVLFRIADPKVVALDENINGLHQRIMDEGIVPSWMEVVKIKNLAALVEFEDGSVKVVNSDDLKFTDSGFDLYSFTTTSYGVFKHHE